MGYHKRIQLHRGEQIQQKMDPGGTLQQPKVHGSFDLKIISVLLSWNCRKQ